MSRKLRSETDCLNCGTEVKDKYCPHCGQPNYEPRESFRHIMTHFVTDYLHLDEKFFSSLKYLLFSPGKLTNEYNSGRRMTYVHPFRLYIFITIVFFIVQGVNSNENKLKLKQIEENGDTTIMISPAMETDVDTAQGEVNMDYSWSEVEDTTVEQYEKRQAALPEAERDDFFRSYFNKKTIIANQQKFNLSEKIMQNFQHNIPKMMFLILPVFALILQIFFRRKKLYYVEHFYHSVYLHCFFYLYRLAFVIPFKFLPETWKEGINLVMIIGLAVYFYRSLIKVYNDNAILTIVKGVFVIALYFVALLILVVGNGVLSFMLL